MFLPGQLRGLRGVLLGSAALMGLLLGACVGNAPSRPNPDAGTGGASAIDGAAGGGGATDGGGSGGFAGATGSGGISGTGGGGGMGGLTGTGGAGTGGATATGGATGTGRAAGAGGASGAGGGNCVKALFGRYVVRIDGKLLYEADDGSQMTVLDASSGLPLTDVTGAQEGRAHGCATLGTAQSSWCWRTVSNGNISGQLANGAMDASGAIFTATQVLTAVNKPLLNVSKIADGEAQYSGSSNSCAVTGDGRLYCWGNLTWITGGGTALSSAYAVPITTDGITPLAGVLQVAVSDGDACAIVQGASSRELWCWGQNFYGEIGLGDQTPHRYPTKVVGLTNPLKVVMPGTTTCALDGSGVRCWGQNNSGLTGTGLTAASIFAPTVVTLMGGTPLTGAVDLHAGDSFGYGDFCALTVNNTLLCWGISLGAYASAFGLTNVVALGGIDNGSAYVRYVTSDGVYHLGANTRAPNCGPLQ